MLRKQRIHARKKLIEFASYTKPDYVAASHHKLIAERLEAVERGELRRLIVQCPPRHGKSELVSIRFPAYCIGRRPNRQIIQASYNSDFAAQFGRAVRNVVASKEFGRLFPHVTLSPDSKSAGLWHTSAGGVYLSTGVGGASTGFGADLLNLDDPIKSREEADSETYRERLYDWFSAVARTRLMPNGAIVLTYTPWHEDDLGQRLIERMSHGGEQWEVLRLPAICEEPNDPVGRNVGDALWPEWYDLKSLGEMKSAMEVRDWSALMQCSPLPAGGDFFLRDWFQYFDLVPRGARKYLTSDFALSGDEQGDYTVHALWAVDDAGAACLLELWRDRLTSDETVDVALDMIAEHKPIAWINEKGSILKALGPFVHKRMRERRIFCRMVEYPRSVDKVMFARPFQARLAQGMVKFKRDADWLVDLERELLSFPAAKHDDQVDACGLLGHHLEAIVKPAPGADRRRGMPQMRLNIDPLRG